CGTGVGPKKLGYILGLAKAYATRVGSGPFPTECKPGFDQEAGEWMAQKGQEFGSTTGRPRRCGWLDLVALKRAVELNSFDGLATWRLDVMSGMKEIKLGLGYMRNIKLLSHFPKIKIEDLQVRYEVLPGSESLQSATQVYQLQMQARKFIHKNEEF